MIEIAIEKSQVLQAIRQMPNRDRIEIMEFVLILAKLNYSFLLIGFTTRTRYQIFVWLDRKRMIGIS